MKNSICFIEENFDSKFILEYNLSPFLNGLSLVNNADLFIGITNIEFYSSPKIQEILINIVNKSIILEPVRKNILKLIQNKKIILGYTDPSKFRFVFEKIKNLFGRSTSEKYVGLYSVSEDKIYLILDNNVDLMGHEIYSIDKILSHELCHMATVQYKKTKIIQKTINSLLLFYSEVIRNVTQLLLNKNISYDVKFKRELKDTIYELIDINECLDSNIDIKIKNSYNIWKKFLSKILFNNLEEVNLITKAVLSLYIFNYHGEHLIKNDKYEIISHIDEIENIFIEAYKNIGITRIINIPGQEFIFPSEIISICSQNGIQNNVVSSLNKISLEL